MYTWISKTSYPKLRPVSLLTVYMMNPKHNALQVIGEINTPCARLTKHKDSMFDLLNGVIRPQWQRKRTQG